MYIGRWYFNRLWAVFLSCFDIRSFMVSRHPCHFIPNMAIFLLFLLRCGTWRTRPNSFCERFLSQNRYMPLTKAAEAKLWSEDAHWTFDLLDVLACRHTLSASRARDHCRVVGAEAQDTSCVPYRKHALKSGLVSVAIYWTSSRHEHCLHLQNVYCLYQKVVGP